MTGEKAKKSTVSDTIVWHAHEGERVTRAGDFDIIACGTCGFRHASKVAGDPIDLDAVYREGTIGYTKGKPETSSPSPRKIRNGRSSRKWTGW